MSGGFFRGTSADQDTRFSNKQAKLLKSQKFAPELEHLVDMTKVKMDVIRPWIANRVTELIGIEDEVLINFIYGLLDGKKVNGKEVQISLTGFMERNTGKFMKELWILLLSAQSNSSGVPQQFLDAKEEETKKKKAESDRLANEIQRRKEKEIQELEEERSAKMDRGNNLKDVANGAEPSSKHERRPSAARLVEEKDLKDKHGSRGRSRGRRSRSISKSISDSDERRRSRSPSVSTKRRGHSSSPEKDHSFSPRRSITPRGRHAPHRSRSPNRRSTYSRKRSLSRPDSRSPSPRRYRIRRRSRSPLRRRSRSPYWHRPRSPPRRSSPWNRSRSTIRRRSPSPIRRKSPSLVRRSSPSPLRRKYRGSPSLRHSSESPIHRRSRSPIRRRSPSPIRRRSRSPVQRMLRSPIRRRSPSPVQRKSLSPIHDMSASPIRYELKSLSGSRSPRRSSRLTNPKSQDSSSASPVERRSRSPVRRKSPKRQERSPSSPRGRIRELERCSPVRDGVTRNVVDSPTDVRQRSNSMERRSDSVNQKDSRRKLKRQTPSPHRSCVSEVQIETNLIEKRKSTEMKYNSSAKPLSPDKHKHLQTKVNEEASTERGNKSEKLEHQKKPDQHDSQKLKDALLSEKKRDSPIKGRNREKKNLSRSVDTRINDRHLERLPELSGKGKQDDWIPSAGSDSELEEIDKNRAKVEEKRKSKRSERLESGSDDESSSDSYADERKKAKKRRRKEEKKLRKEKRKRREEKHRRKEEKRSGRQKMKSGGTVSTLSDTDGKRDDDFDDDRVKRCESGQDDVEEPLNEQKKLEIELREKAIELYMAKKGISH